MSANVSDVQVQEAVPQYEAPQFGEPIGVDPQSATCIDTSRLAEFGKRHIEELYRRNGSNPGAPRTA